MSTFARLCFACGMALGASLASAQGWPTKPVTLIVPNPPGGSIDIQGRILATKLQEMYHSPVVVEYKAGGGTLIGMDYTAKSAPDGYTMCLAATPLVILPAVQPKMPYDTVKDLAGVTETAYSSIMIAAPPNSKANNLAEIIAEAKKNPGKLTYGTPGIGSSMHFSMELLKLRAGVDILHVPFKGGAQAYPEVMAGRIDLYLDPTFGLERYVKSGKVKAIAVTSLKPDPAAPGVPAVSETLPGFDVLSINGIVVPRATPRDLVHRLNTDIVKVLKEPDVVQKLTELGLTTVGNTPEQFDELIKTEIERWIGVAKKANIKFQ